MRFRPVLLWALPVLAFPAWGAIAPAVISELNSGNFRGADRMMEAYRSKHAADSDLALAESWVARAYLQTGQIDIADQRAGVTRELAGAVLAHGTRLDADEDLATALGAGIEVHAQVLARRGDRAGAVAFLREELARWRATSLGARIQKNLNLLTMEGHPAPPIDVAHWVGPVRPQPLSALRGHPVLLFFWAHWCVDCKADAPIMAALEKKYGPRGLKIVGPTQLYGYAQSGDPATPAQEKAWIETTRAKFYSQIGDMPVPLSGETARSYGVSTTPTIVLLDKQGIVRLYHPGAMRYEELAPRIEASLK